MFIQNHLRIGHKYRPGIRLVPQSITIHNTGNPSSSARGERGWLDNPTNNRVASWHYVVDGKEVIQAIPDNEVAYHAGQAANMSSIGIEICEIPGSYENGVKFVAWLLNKYGWGVDKLTTHFAWTRKECPRLILPIWDQFVAQVQRELDLLKGGAQIVQANVLIEMNGVVRQFDGAMMNGRTYAPIRALLESLGYVVNWDAARNMVVITSKWAN